MNIPEYRATRPGRTFLSGSHPIGRGSLPLKTVAVAWLRDRPELARGSRGIAPQELEVLAKMADDNPRGFLEAIGITVYH
jgi:hypothetical protein